MPATVIGERIGWPHWIRTLSSKVPATAAASAARPASRTAYVASELAQWAPGLASQPETRGIRSRGSRVTCHTARCRSQGGVAFFLAPNQSAAPGCEAAVGGRHACHSQRRRQPAHRRQPGRGEDLRRACDHGDQRRPRCRAGPAEAGSAVQRSRPRGAPSEWRRRHRGRSRQPGTWRPARADLEISRARRHQGRRRSAHRPPAPNREPAQPGPLTTQAQRAVSDRRPGEADATRLIMSWRSDEPGREGNTPG